MWSRSRVERSCVGHRVRCSTYTQYAIHKLSKSTHVVRFHISSHLVVVSFWLFSESVCATPHFQPRPPTRREGIGSMQMHFGPRQLPSTLCINIGPTWDYWLSHPSIAIMDHLHTRDFYHFSFFIDCKIGYYGTRCTLLIKRRALAYQLHHIFTLHRELSESCFAAAFFSVGRKSLLFMPSKRLTARLRPH